MSYNKFVVIFRSTLLLGLASGTAWADHPIVSNISNPPGQPGQITRSHVASSGDIWVYCTWVASSCATGSFDAVLRQNHAVARRDPQVATAEIPAVTLNPTSRSGQDIPLVWSNPGRVSNSPVGSNRPDSTIIRTGVFPGGEERIVTDRLIGQVQTGVFEGPERFLDEAQGDNPRNTPKLGFWALPVGRGAGSQSEESHIDQGRQLGKKGWAHRIWSRSSRDR